MNVHWTQCSHIISSEKAGTEMENNQSLSIIYNITSTDNPTSFHLTSIVTSNFHFTAAASNRMYVYMCICMCSVLGHWRGIGLLVSLYVCIYMYVFCLGSLARYWFARKPVCMYIYICMCSVLGHWRGIGLLVNPNVYMYVCVLSWVTGAALVCP